MTRAAERLFALVRATLRNRMDDASLFEGTDAAQWREIYEPGMGFSHGTIFRELDKPFLWKGGRCR